VFCQAKFSGWSDICQQGQMKKLPITNAIAYICTLSETNKKVL
jgi:hypothetical protein